ncbi:lactonase family protein [Neorhizobium alkalisoli]|uniref:6-phosphogluconolactonase n=1 Tax=Neorhizobium alkalisoli TaxID=528178 RepID=A0A561R7G0_9HYPH|nr:lactonase family protein [Neorhizobium alkalisoli]TWF58540.1 6-phosphogluconolactonase [Neorhizobium alkalisoli]
MDTHLQDKPDTFLIVGSYTETLPHVVGKGMGISVLRMDGGDGSLSPVSSLSGLRNPTYLSLSNDGNMLYAVEEIAHAEGAGARALRFDREVGTLVEVAKVSAHGDCPCHVATDHSGRRLFISNYVSGNLAAYALDEAGVPTGDAVDIRRSGSGPNRDRQEGPHLHQATATPGNAHVLVCDAGTDEIARYPLGDVLIGIDPDLVVKTRPGGLPRHLVFAQNGKHVFVVEELGCSVSTYSYDGQGIGFLSEVSTLPDGFDGDCACAAIRLHPNGRFLYASNRGPDTIAAFEIVGSEGLLKPVGFYPTLGRIPRDFAIDPTGRFLVAANQDSHSLVVFAIDQQTGALAPTGQSFETGSPVCLVFA